MSGIAVNSSSQTADLGFPKAAVEIGRHGPITIDYLCALVENQGMDSVPVRQAAEWAMGAQRTMMALQKDWRPYDYPLGVATTVAALQLDRSATAQKESLEPIIAALLHGAVAVDVISLSDIEETFGVGVASLTDEVTRITKIRRNIHAQRELTERELSYNQIQFELGQEALCSLPSSSRVIPIKIADCLQTMRTLGNIKVGWNGRGEFDGGAEERIRVALFADGIFLPIMHGFEWDDASQELEQLIMKHIDPDATNRIAEGMKRFGNKGALVRRIEGRLRETIRPNRTKIRYRNSLYRRVLIRLQRTNNKIGRFVNRGAKKRNYPEWLISALQELANPLLSVVHEVLDSRVHQFKAITVFGRAKSDYAIWKKMLRRQARRTYDNNRQLEQPAAANTVGDDSSAGGLNERYSYIVREDAFDELFAGVQDKFAFRCRVTNGNDQDSYRIAMALQGVYGTVPDLHHDYLANPRGDYRVLHVGVNTIDPHAGRVETEIQIFREADEVASYSGPQHNHPRYKRTKSVFGFLKAYHHAQRHRSYYLFDNYPLLQEIRGNMQARRRGYRLLPRTRPRRVIALGNDGAYVPINVTEGADPLKPSYPTIGDFAYAVHSDMATHVVAAVVNGAYWDLKKPGAVFDYNIVTGDEITLIQDPQYNNLERWMGHLRVKSSREEHRRRMNQLKRTQLGNRLAQT